MDLVPSPVAIAPTIPAKATCLTSGGILGSFRPGVFFTMSVAAVFTTDVVPAASALLRIWSSVCPFNTPVAMLLPMLVTAVANAGLLITLFTSDAMAGFMTCEVTRPVTALPMA
jgi:hypothetical protein